MHVHLLLLLHENRESMFELGEREIIQCVCQFTIGGAHISLQPPEMLSLSLLLPLLLSDSDTQISSQERSYSQRVCVRLCVC